MHSQPNVFICFKMTICPSLSSFATHMKKCMLITNAYFVCIFSHFRKWYVICNFLSGHKWQIKQHNFFSNSKLWLLWCFNTAYLFFWHICVNLSMFLLLSLSLLKASLNLEMVRKLSVMIMNFLVLVMKAQALSWMWTMSGLKAADERLVYVPDGCHSFSLFLSLSSSAPPPTHIHTITTSNYHPYLISVVFFLLSSGGVCQVSVFPHSGLTEQLVGFFVAFVVFLQWHSHKHTQNSDSWGWFLTHYFFN